MVKGGGGSSWRQSSCFLDGAEQRFYCNPTGGEKSGKQSLLQSSAVSKRSDDLLADQIWVLVCSLPSPLRLL